MADLLARAGRSRWGESVLRERGERERRARTLSWDQRSSQQQSTVGQQAERTYVASAGRSHWSAAGGRAVRSPDGSVAWRRIIECGRPTLLSTLNLRLNQRVGVWRLYTIYYMHTHCPGEGNTYRRPCPSTGEGHGVDVDCRLLSRVRDGPRFLSPLSIQLDIPVSRMAHTYEAAAAVRI